MTDLRSIKVIVLGGLAMLLALTLPSFSTAMFTSSSSSTLTVGAAADWVAPKVSIVDLPAQVSGTHILRAQASDEFGTGVANVTIETRQAGGTWAALCTDTSAPYECSWTTTHLSSGSYEIRARATDRAGLVGTSSIAATSVGNGRLVLDHPGHVVSGSATLTARMSGWFLHTLRIEYREAGGRWQQLCSGFSWELSCTWDTTGLRDGQYDLRASASRLLTTDEHTISNITVDNSGTRPRAASVLPKATQPVTASVDEDRAEPDAQKVAPVERRPVDAAVEDDSKEQAVVEPAREEAPPIAPGDDENEVAPGDGGDVLPGDDEQTSPDDDDNEQPGLRGVGMTVSNGGTPGSLDQGDAFSVTYSGEIDLTTVLPGWSGEATPVSARVRDGALPGGGTQDDTLDIRSGEMPVELGQVHLGTDVVDNEQQILLPATMTVQTVTVDDAVRTTITVTLGAVIDEDEVLRPASTTPALIWTASAAVTTLTGRPCLTETVTQSAGGTF